MRKFSFVALIGLLTMFMLSSCSKKDSDTANIDPKGSASGLYSGYITYTYINSPSVEGQNDTSTTRSNVSFNATKTDAGLQFSQISQDSASGKFVIKVTSSSYVFTSNNIYLFNVDKQTTFLNGENREIIGSLWKKVSSTNPIDYDGSYSDNLKLNNFQVKFTNTTPVNGKILVLATFFANKQ